MILVDARRSPSHASPGSDFDRAPSNGPTPPTTAPWRGRPRGSGPASPAVITTSPFVAGFAPLRWAGRVTFYAWDEWTSGLPLRHWWPAYEEAYARVGQSGRAVVAVSQAIVDRIMPTGPSAMVPNGVAPEEWRSPPAPPAWFAALPLAPHPVRRSGGRPPRRLRRPRGRRSIPSGTVVFLGPRRRPNGGGSAAQHPKRLDRAAGGSGGGASLVHAAEACVMPHRRTRITAAMSPLKLYEYLAGGRPVAATDLPPVQAVHPRIVRVREGDSFAGRGRRGARPGTAGRGRAACVHRRQFVAATPRRSPRPFSRHLGRSAKLSSGRRRRRRGSRRCHQDGV